MGKDNHKAHWLFRVGGGLIVGLASYIIFEFSPWGDANGLIFLSVVLGVGFALVGK